MLCAYARWLRMVLAGGVGEKQARTRDESQGSKQAEREKEKRQSTGGRDAGSRSERSTGKRRRQQNARRKEREEEEQRKGGRQAEQERGDEAEGAGGRRAYAVWGGSAWHGARTCTCIVSTALGSPAGSSTAYGRHFIRRPACQGSRDERREASAGAGGPHAVSSPPDEGPKAAVKPANPKQTKKMRSAGGAVSVACWKGKMRSRRRATPQPATTYGTGR